MSELIEVCHSARLTPATYQFYRAVLLSCAERDGAPDQVHLRRLAARFGVPVAATLAECAAKGLLQRDPTTGAIQVAYPFSGVPTAHLVTLGALGATPAPAAGDAGSDRDRRPIFAMCALDALGIPLMLRRDALIASQDALTGEPIAVQVRVTEAAALTETAGWEVHWTPVSTVVYARAPAHEHEHECGVDAASACCPVINFFTTQAHAQAWVETHPVADGVLLTQVEAMRYAHANFGRLLDRL